MKLQKAQCLVLGQVPRQDTPDGQLCYCCLAFQPKEIIEKENVKHHVPNNSQELCNKGIVHQKVSIVIIYSSCMVLSYTLLSQHECMKNIILLFE